MAPQANFAIAVSPPPPPPDTIRSMLRCTWPPSVSYSDDSGLQDLTVFIRENIDCWDPGYAEAKQPFDEMSLREKWILPSIAKTRIHRFSRKPHWFTSMINYLRLTVPVCSGSTEVCHSTAPSPARWRLLGSEILACRYLKHYHIPGQIWKFEDYGTSKSAPLSVSW